MKVASKLKKFSIDINTVGLYDEAEEREKMINSVKAEGEMLGEKKGAKMREKAIAKNLLKIGISKENIMRATGPSEAQIVRLM